MPVASTPRELAKAVRTRRTKTTRALKKLLTNPGQHRGTADFNRLTRRNALNRPLRSWARNRLQNLSADELNHIDDWPDEGKEKVRQALVDAILNNRAVRFFWEVHPGQSEVTLIENPDMTGGITITFRSPEKNVQGGNVTVKVGP